ncbi:hypothetical protein [Actinoplanes sp. URMC 104]|uniref:hypothetical protein n=1 Tax=Actinoplanes sp. URMC 104 TaxID=3423409 RepID=UPI003F1E3493
MTAQPHTTSSDTGAAGDTPKKTTEAAPKQPEHTPAQDTDIDLPLGVGDDEQPIIQTGGVTKDQGEPKQDKVPAARKERLVPAAPLLTIGGGSFATLVPMIAQAATPSQMLWLGGGAAAATALGVGAKVSRGKNGRAGRRGGGRSAAFGSGGVGGGRRGGLLGALSSLGGGVGPRATKGAAGGVGRKTSAAGAVGSPGSRAGRKGAGLLTGKGAGLLTGKGRGTGVGKTGGKGLFGAGSPQASGATSRAGKTGKHRAGRGAPGATRRAASTVGRALAAPLRAGSYGLDGAKGASSAAEAVRRARKKHRKDAQKGRTRSPWRGWGAALAGLGAYGIRRAGRGLIRLWKWTPPEPPSNDPPKQRVANTIRQDPNAPQPRKDTQSTSKPISVPKTPIQPISAPQPTSNGAKTMSTGRRRRGNSAILTHMHAALAEAKRRANAGARPGMLEVVDDAHDLAEAVDIMAEILRIESIAYQRMPFHRAVLATMANATSSVGNAANVMKTVNSTAEQIHREQLDKLRNPQHANEQMWDQSANGGVNGGA